MVYEPQFEEYNDKNINKIMEEEENLEEFNYIQKVDSLDEEKNNMINLLELLNINETESSCNLHINKIEETNESFDYKKTVKERIKNRIKEGKEKKRIR